MSLILTTNYSHENNEIIQGFLSRKSKGILNDKNVRARCHKSPLPSASDIMLNLFLIKPLADIIIHVIQQNTGIFVVFFIYKH